MGEEGINSVKISFGIIVLNGEPFTKYCIRQLYPHAHEIIVVEGGSEKAKGIAPFGRSVDGTLESLRELVRSEDPENKITVITKEGFWSGKDEQSQAYAERATGNYLWQIDIDEFYKHGDIIKIKEILSKNKNIDALSFRQLTFWGWFDYCCDSVYLRTVNASEYHRMFKWNQNYEYAQHRPPTVVDENGNDLRSKNWLNAKDTESLGINLYHYSLLFPKQVTEKCNYYSAPGESHKSKMDVWASNCYIKIGHPFKVHNVEQYPSWLDFFKGDHPEQIECLRADILKGDIEIAVRDNADVELLLSNRFYKLGRFILIFSDSIGLFKLLLFFRRLFG